MNPASDGNERPPISRSAVHREARQAWIFLTPMLAAMILVAAWPLGRTILLSLTDARFGVSEEWRFVGLQNYLTLWQDDRWWSAVRVTIAFALVSVAIETVLGLAIALVLNARLHGRGMLRAAMLVPWAIPVVVSARMWAWMLNDLNGVVNAALQWLGLTSGPVAWLADPIMSMVAIIAVDVWKTTPFMALLSLAALQSIPEEIHEAAVVDGAGPIRTFLWITLPIIAPALIVAVLFRLMDALLTCH